MRSCMRGTVDWETQLSRSLLVSSSRIFSISWRMSSEKSLTSCLISAAQVASISTIFWRTALENSAQADTKRDTAARTSTMEVLRHTSLSTTAVIHTVISPNLLPAPTSEHHSDRTDKT